MVYATIWGRSPVGLPRPDQASLGKDRLEFLQRVAWETVQSYGAAAAGSAPLAPAPPAVAAAPPLKFAAPPRALGAVRGAAAAASRTKLTAEIFEALDRDADGALSAPELRRFEDFVGFNGGEGAWAEEFANVASEVGCDPAAGVSLQGFRQLVDRGTERGVFSTHCTDDELRELAEELRVEANDRAAPRQVVIVPGNGGGGSIWDSNWYGWLADELKKRGVAVSLRNMPDPHYARESRWLPFITEELAGGAANLPRTVVVGHSSGAAAAMRLAEQQRLAGMVLVAAYTSDLGDDTERKSGYFARPWQWAKQRENCGFLVQFASTDDPFLPIEEQRKVRDGLSPAVEYLEFDGRSHFFDWPFKELLEVLLQRLGVDGGGGKK